MKENSKIKDFKNYTKTLPSSTIKVLEEIRKIVKAQVPKAEETISYQMPAFKLKKVFFYYAGFKNHIGIYPPIKKDKKLLKELAPFAGPKGNLKFPLDKPIPFSLIERVAICLAKEYE